MFLRCLKPRPENKTGVVGIHKFVYHPRIKKSKKKQVFPDKWTVQIKCRHICICYSFEEAVRRRLEEEIKEGMYEDISQSSAYQYLEQNNLLK